MKGILIFIAGALTSLALVLIFGSQYRISIERATPSTPADTQRRSTQPKTDFSDLGFVPDKPGSIPANEAQSHIGETAIVEGVVAAVRATRRGTVFLDLGSAFPNETFTAVSFTIPESDLQQFEGHVIDVSGRIQDYKGRPEIVLTSLNQITVQKSSQ